MSALWLEWHENNGNFLISDRSVTLLCTSDKISLDTMCFFIDESVVGIPVGITSQCNSRALVAHSTGPMSLVPANDQG